MNQLKGLLLFGLTILCSAPLLAQNVHIGLSTAGNATFVLDKGLSADPRYNSTYTFNMAPVGVKFGVDFSRKVGLSLESIMAKQGQIYELIDIGKKVAGERKIDMSYIQLPLLLQFMGGGESGVRGNFNIGPQFSMLTKAIEILQAGPGNYAIPTDLQSLSATDLAAALHKDFPTAVINPDGTYTLPTVGQDMAIPSGVTLADIQSAYPTATAGTTAGKYSLTDANMTKDLLTNQVNDFKNMDLQIAAAFGLSIDLSKHLFMTTQIRANYSLVDTRASDLLNALQTNKTGDLLGRRANLLIGFQLGLSYSFRVTRSFLNR